MVHTANELLLPEPLQGNSMTLRLQYQYHRDYARLLTGNVGQANRGNGTQKR